MALKILNRGNNNTYADLVEEAFTQINYLEGTTVNDTLDATSPRGVLGGSLAGIHGAGLVGKADADHRVVGWFVNNAEGDPFDNAPAVASNKGVFIRQLPMIQIDVYETHLQDGTDELTYAAGDLLYTSTNGFATNEAPDVGNDVDSTVVGIVLDVPTAENPFMTILSQI